MTPIWFVLIDETVDEHRLTPQGALIEVERMDYYDRPIHYNHHIFRYPNHFDTNPDGWYWGRRERFIARYALGGESRYYPYRLTFEDGTTGICRVPDLNDALAAIGYRVDLDPPI